MLCGDKTSFRAFFRRPYLVPCREFARRDLIPCKTSFVQAEQFGFGHLLKLFPVTGLDMLLCKPLNLTGGRFPVQSRTNDSADNLTKGIAVLEPERIGFSE